MSTTTEILDRCRAIHEDLGLREARTWKETAPGRKVIGFLPTWVPRELIDAAGMLPFGIIGGGDRVEIIKGDAYFQSYLCHLPRSVIELALSGRLGFLDGVLFPSICDVIRNLSGMWQMLFPGQYVRYVDVPQDFDPRAGGEWCRRDLQALRDDLARIAGREISDTDLRRSLEHHNENRRLVRALLDLRSRQPWRVSVSESWLLLRAGLALPVEEHSALLSEWMTRLGSEARPERDDARIVLRGAFCEQPPLDLLRTLERAGCAVVDDDFFLATRWFGRDVPVDGDPIQALAEAQILDAIPNPARFEPDVGRRGRRLVETVRDLGADGVVFAAPSFCDPALLERPMLQRAVEEAGIPFTSFKYAENTGQLQPIREQAGTFSDSIKLWSSP